MTMREIARQGRWVRAGCPRLAAPTIPAWKEAMRLMQAFLAIEDTAGRAALITLAERLVSHDWAHKVQQG